MSYTGTPQNNMYRRGNAPGGPSPPGGAQQTYGAATPTYPQQNGTYPNSPVPPPRQNDGTNSSNGGGYALPPHSSPPSHSYTSSQQQEDNSKNKTPRKRMSIDARVQTKQWVAKNYSNLVLYFGLIVGVVFFYHLMSDGDFSFLLTLGSIIRTFAFGVLVANVVTSKSVAGVSLKMIQLYVIVFSSRLASILFYEGYLPFDSSGDFLYRAMEVSSLILCVVILILGYTMFTDTYNSTGDSFGNFLFLPSVIGILWVVIPAFCLALIFHPSLNSNFITDVSWTFALALESTAVLPQIIMFIKSLKGAAKGSSRSSSSSSNGGAADVVQPWVSHVLSSLGLARLIHLVFWISSYTELNDKFNSSPGGAHVGHFVVFSQCVQLLLMCDYLYYYVKALYSGGDITDQLQNNWATNGKDAGEFA